MFTREENEIINMMRELLGIHVDEYEALEVWEDLGITLLTNAENGKDTLVV